MRVARRALGHRASLSRGAVESTGLARSECWDEVVGPFLHQLAAAVEQIAAEVRRHEAVGHLVRQRGLHHGVRRVGPFRRTVAERGPEAVRDSADAEAEQ